MYLKMVDTIQVNINELNKAIQVTRDDFDIISEYGKHLGPTAEFNKEQFREMMNGELWRYSRRQLDNVLSLTGDDRFQSTILMVKIFEAQVSKDLGKMLDLLKSIMQHLDIKNEDASRSTVAVEAGRNVPAENPLSDAHERRGGSGGAAQQFAAEGAGTGSSMMLEEVRMLANKMDQQHKMLANKIDQQHKMLEEHKRLLERQAEEIADIKHEKREYPQDEASGSVSPGSLRRMKLPDQSVSLVCDLVEPRFVVTTPSSTSGQASNAEVCVDDSNGASQDQDGQRSKGVKASLLRLSPYHFDYSMT